MGKTSIEWLKSSTGLAGYSWNALRAERKVGGRPGITANHCEHVNEACRFCYAESLNARLGGLPFKPGHRKDYRFFVDEEKLTAPLRMRKPTRIFVESMSDAFGDWWPDHFIEQLYAVMGATPQHTYINLSKRPERRRRFLEAGGTLPRIAGQADRMSISFPVPAHWPFPNVIEGTSVSCQAEADEFVPILLQTKAALRCVSAEPLLGPIDFTALKTPRYPLGLNALISNADGSRLDWLIVGGESGPRARIMPRAAARSIEQQCRGAGVPFFYKQNGSWIDADEWLRIVRADEDFSVDWNPKLPLNFKDAGTLADITGHRVFEHQSDGTTMIRVGKSAAGRLLDGAEHNGFPGRSE